MDDEKAVPWNRSNHLTGTKLLLSSEDSNYNVSRPPGRARPAIIN
jgi:hypothetical protein